MNFEHLDTSEKVKEFVIKDVGNQDVKVRKCGNVVTIYLNNAYYLNKNLGVTLVSSLPEEIIPTYNVQTYFTPTNTVTGCIIPIGVDAVNKNIGCNTYFLSTAGTYNISVAITYVI